MIGKRFGRLEVIEVVGKDNYRKNIYRCLCDCGNYTNAVSTKLTAGKKKSCGCLMKEYQKELSGKVTHGESGTPEYICWVNIKGRCCNPNHPSYPDYGGRGITLCKEWENDFGKFFEEVGHRPSEYHSIERVDNNKGYEPGNIRWALLDEQSLNKRWTIWVEYNGENWKLTDLCRKLGKDPVLVRGRYKQGWTLENALNGFIKKPETLTINGVTKSKKEWLDEYGIKKSTFDNRVKNGISHENALKMKPQKGVALETRQKFL